MNFKEAIKAAIKNKAAVRRPEWPADHVLMESVMGDMLIYRRQKTLDGTFPFGYRPTDEDKAANDWLISDKP